MAEALNFQINIGGKEQIISTFGELKKAIKEAEFEALKLSQQFGEADPRVVSLREEIGKLKDNIQDSAEATKNFAKGAGAFPAIGRAIQGIASGFAAVQGILGVIGVESEEVQKSLLKVQSALALAQGIEGILQAEDSFKNLSGIINNKVIPSIKALGTAAQVGIGLLIAAVGTAIYAWMDYIDTQEQVKKAQEETNKAIEKGSKAQLEGSVAELERQQKLAIAQLQSKKNNEKDIYETEQQFRRLRIKRLQDFYNEQTNKDSDASIAALNQIKNLQTEIEVAELNFNAQQVEREKAKNAKLKEERDKKAKEEYDTFVNHVNLLKQQSDAEIDLQKYLIDEQKRKEQELFDWRVLQAQKVTSQTEAEIQLQKYLYDKDVAAKRTAEDMKYQIVQNYIDAVGFLFDRGTAAGKVAAIASIALNVAQGYTNGLRIAQESSRGPQAAFAFPLFYSTQVLAILQAAAKAKQVLATVKGGGALSFPTPTGQSPLAPQAPSAQLTQLNQATINALGNQAIRAYVVETDITTNQKRIEAIKQKAKFG